MFGSQIAQAGFQGLGVDWWTNASGGASGAGGVSDAAVRARRAAATAQAAQAAAQAAQATAAVGAATAATVVDAARRAASQTWENVTGGVDGYAETESSIISQAANIAASMVPGGIGISTEPFETSASFASDALSSAANSVIPLGIGAALGGGTILAIGAGLFLLLLLSKR